MSILRRLVIPGAFKVVRQVLLSCDVVGLIVRVEVPVAMAESLRTGVVRVAQMCGYRSPAPGANIRDGAVNRQIGRVRLRRSRNGYDRLSEE